MHDGHTLSAPQRSMKGFGCPGCGSALPTNPVALRRAAVRGLLCCGKQVDDPARLIRAAEALERADG